ncbi:MAG: hypothetical protein Q7T71_06615, partial [Herbiconiux sp.]|nr:hypothetical protein [Herbiconiux sp.]
MTQPTLASFLLPEGLRRPPVVAVLRESSVVGEVGRHVLSRRSERRARRAVPYAGRSVPRTGDPVLLVPGFL